MIVRAVRVGIPISEAVRAVARENEAPTAGEFARLADQMAIGCRSMRRCVAWPSATTSRNIASSPPR